MGMGFQFEQHRLGLWDLSWDLKKTISWEMGLGPPLHDPHKKTLERSVTKELRDKGFLRQKEVSESDEVL